MRRHLSVVGIQTVCVVLCGAGSAMADFANYRSIFVDRFDYTYNSGNIPQMTQAINNQIAAAAAEGFTEIIWQVRGRADALYNSNYEPATTGLTPGFDPLQVALTAAHNHGLKLHAWINTTPMWNTTAVNPPEGHVYHNTAPSFRLMDTNGNFEPQQGWSNYSSVNPILPEVHTHINNVVSDIMANYAVDGIHLDYIRYIPGTASTGSFARMPHDPVSHQMFFDATGLDGSNIANFAAYKTFLTDRITDLVRSVKENVDAAEVATGRTMELTASLFFEPNRAKNEYAQDFGRWINEGLLDVAMPMIYISQLNAHLFDPYLESALSFVNPATGTRVAPTIASYLHMDPTRGGGVELTLNQLQSSYNKGAHGVGFYDYPAFFNEYSEADRQQIKNFFDSIAPPPEPGPPGPGNVIEDFEAGLGHFKWPWNASPGSQTFGLADDENGTTVNRVSHDAQGGAWSQLLNFVIDDVGNSTWQQRHNSSINNQVAHPSGNVPLEPTGYVGFWLKTNDPNVQVRISIDDPVPDGATALELSTWQSVVADDQWHLYQWNLEDISQWIAIGNPGSNGQIDAYYGTVTIDSIWFAGDGNAQVYLDRVSHNPLGTLAAAERIPGDYNGDGVVDAADRDTWQTTFGSTVAPGAGADGNGDGVVDAADFVLWRKMGVPTAGAGGAVPEPSNLLLVLVAWAASSIPWRRR